MQGRVPNRLVIRCAKSRLRFHSRRAAAIAIFSHFRHQRCPTGGGSGNRKKSGPISPTTNIWGEAASSVALGVGDYATKTVELLTFKWDKKSYPTV